MPRTHTFAYTLLSVQNALLPVPLGSPYLSFKMTVPPPSGCFSWFGSVWCTCFLLCAITVPLALGSYTVHHWFTCLCFSSKALTKSFDKGSYLVWFCIFSDCYSAWHVLSCNTDCRHNHRNNGGSQAKVISQTKMFNHRNWITVSFLPIYRNGTVI